jgi:hypothetical protein
MEGRLEGVLTRILGKEEPEPWFEKAPVSPRVSADDPLLKPLFAAYREFRIEHQRAYADFKIRDDNRILSSAARRQATVLESFGFACIVLLLSIDIAVGVAILIGWIAGASPARALMPVLSAATIWIAVAALAGRAF